MLQQIPVNFAKCIFYSKGELCDVELVTDLKEEAKTDGAETAQHRIRAHRCVLSASCEYFRAKFRSAITECQKNEIGFKVMSRNLVK